MFIRFYCYTEHEKTNTSNIAYIDGSHCKFKNVDVTDAAIVVSIPCPFSAASETNGRISLHEIKRSADKPAI